MNKKQLEKGLVDLGLETLKFANNTRKQFTEISIEIDRLRNENYMLRKHLGVELVREVVEGEDKGLTIKKTK